MARNIYFRNVTNNIDIYTYNGNNHLELQARSIDLDTSIGTDDYWTSHLWQSKKLATEDIPSKDSGYCVQGGGYLSISISAVSNLYWDQFWTFGAGTSDNRLLTSHWTSHGWDMSTYDTFTEDIATHLNMAPSTFSTINALVFYNLRISTINYSLLQYTDDHYLSGFWSYWGNDPAYEKVISL